MVSADAGRDAFLSGNRDELPTAVDAQLATANLTFSAGFSTGRSSARFATNEDFWGAVLRDRLRSGSRVRLKSFGVLEWFPRSPGLFHTADAAHKREMAGHDRYPATNELVSALRTVDSSLAVYNTYGKSTMLAGGYGCVRLRDKVTDQGRLWFMSASSSLVAHEGVPVGLPEHIRDQIIDEISERGVVVGDLHGRLLFVPELLNPLYSDYREVPQLYLLVERFQPTPGRREGSKPVASAAVTFARDPGSDHHRFTCAAAYVPFRPGADGDFDRRRDWLAIYVDHHNGRVITDFDEHRSHFPHAAFSLEKISQGRLDMDEITRALLPDRSRRYRSGEIEVNIQQLIVSQSHLTFERTKIGQVMGDSFSNIGAGAVIINRSLLTNAMNRVAGTDGDTAAALQAIAQHVQRSGNQDAGENLDGLLEEMDRPEPRKSRLKTFWDGLVAVLPSVVQLGAASEKMIELVSK